MLEAREKPGDMRGPLQVMASAVGEVAMLPAYRDPAEFLPQTRTAQQPLAAKPALRLPSPEPTPPSPTYQSPEPALYLSANAPSRNVNLDDLPSIDPATYQLANPISANNAGNSRSGSGNSPSFVPPAPSPNAPATYSPSAVPSGDSSSPSPEKAVIASPKPPATSSPPPKNVASPRARNENVLTVEAIAPTHEQAGGVGGFRIWRPHTDGDLVVKYGVRGTARAGTHYEKLSGTVTITDGNRSAAIMLDPLKFDPTTGNKTVGIWIRYSPTYTRGTVRSGKVKLGDFQTNPVVTVQATTPTASDVGDPNNGELIFRRTTTKGNLPVDYTITGTAASGTDYLRLTGRIVIPAGADWVKVRVQPQTDAVLEGPETITVAIAQSTRYLIGEEQAATVTIEDSEDAKGRGPRTPPGVASKVLPDYILIPCDCGCAAPRTPSLFGQLGIIGGSLASLVGNFFSSFPVQFGFGVVRLGSTDLESFGFGLPWGQSRTWSNVDGYDQSSFLGTGWATEQSPHLIISLGASSVAVVFNANISKKFGLQFGTYVPASASPETLTHDATNKEFTFTDSTGKQIVFFDGDLSYPPAKQGGLKKIIDPDGNITEVTSWDSDGRITEVQRSRTVSSVTTIESYLTNYLTSGTNAGRQSDVTLRRKVGSGSWSTARSVTYTYYGTGNSNGAAGDLERAVVMDGSSNVLNTDYYRSYTSNTSPGYTHGLKFYIGGEQYAQLEADLGGAANVDSAADSAIDDYANNYFEYQSDHRVTKEIASGAGCSSCSGGQGEFVFAYTDNPFASGYNSWATKTVLTLPDGNERIVYTNFGGGIMLDAFKNTTTNDIWATFYKFDTDGREILRAEPSAVTGWNDTYGDLMNFMLGSSSYLRDSEGLISTKAYGSSTTATTSTAGDVSGYFKEDGIQRGELGTSIKQSSAKYIKHTANSIDIYPTAEETVYRNTNGTGAETTTFGYSFFSGTNQIEQTTITRPAATTGQNGSNSADVDYVVNDAEGRPIWVKDAGGFIHYTEYDLQTGAIVKIIQDVDTSQTGTFSNLPSGWSTPGGGGLHLTTGYEVNNVGDPTKITDPNGNITYIVYDYDSHETRIYPGWNNSTNAPTGPTIVKREDWARGYREVLTMSATPNLTSSKPNGTESISSVQSLTREVLNEAGQVLYRDEYFDLTGTSYSQSSVTLGTSGTNYNRTTVAYGKLGQLAKTVTPTGTIYRDEIDGQGRLISKWIGTDDVPSSGFWSPSNLTGTDMVKVWEGEYDFGGIGDGLLTEETAFPGGGATDRVTAHSYDWRHRPVADKQGVEGSEGTSVNRPINYYEYDNLNQVIVFERYDGDTLSITTDSNTDGVPDRPSSSALRAKQTFDTDEQGRVYQEKTFSVDPSSGSVSSNALKTNHWFNSRGLEIKSTPHAPREEGGAVAKTEYDGAARAIKSYLTDGGSDSGFSDADDVTGDKVLTQIEWTYDANGNPTLITTRDRFHDETGTGTLGTPSTGNKARVSFAANYFDKADRQTASVNVGTNGGSSYTRPGSVPSRSDSVLVTEFAYNAAGWLETTTDARGVASKQYYNLAGWTTKTIENYVNGVVSDADDKTVEFTYDGNGQTKTLKAYLSSSTFETTEWIYGITSPLVSNDIVKEMRHPDTSTGASSSSEKDQYTYNQLNQVLTFTDRNGTVHTYTYDVLGRVTIDAITTLGSGVDGAIRRIETAYDGQGNAYLITSYDAATSGSIVNQVQREFNGLGQLITEWQAVGSAVNTSTSPKVQYSYSFAPSGSNNHSRLTSITYPNGRVITFNYATGLGDDISRLTSITDGGTTLESYEYLGYGIVVTRGHPQTGVDLTYVKLTGESDGAAGDKYNGLDFVNRIIDQRWTTSTPTAKDRRQYGYDRDGNRLYAENMVDSTRSELYSYDDFNQIVSFDRGTLNGGKNGLTGAASRSQDWDFDALGNWDSLTTNGGTAETRGHNKQNEITSISGASTPTYDANGNMLTDETGRQFVYDGWNRLVIVKNAGGTTLASYKHDGLFRRVRETRGGTTLDLYYSSSWQVLEERISGTAVASYVWSPVYVDAMIARDRDSDANGSLDERLYTLHDANFNIVALVDTSGAVVERFAYDAFGGFVVLTPAWGSRGGSSYAWKYQFQGLKYDADLSGFDARYRILDPEFGRFLQMDPIGFGGGDTNLNSAVGNNPLLFRDPWGLQQTKDPPLAKELPQTKEPPLAKEPSWTDQLPDWIKVLPAIPKPGIGGMLPSPGNVKIEIDPTDGIWPKGSITIKPGPTGDGLGPIKGEIDLNAPFWPDFLKPGIGIQIDPKTGKPTGYQPRIKFSIGGVDCTLRYDIDAKGKSKEIGLEIDLYPLLRPKPPDKKK